MSFRVSITALMLRVDLADTPDRGCWPPPCSGAGFALALIVTETAACRQQAVNSACGHMPAQLGSLGYKRLQASLRWLQYSP
mmetsp:Transcript_60993/g.132267  ORF Transcript_60993/g.132267 Transcript_60993/m.132267 type:complete len:82 (+) Transcript_60993:1854-2099(+)